MSDDIEKYYLLSSGSSSGLSALVEEMLTDGLPIPGCVWQRYRGWELWEQPSSSQSSGKDTRGYAYTANTFCQAMVIKKGNLKIYDTYSKEYKTKSAYGL